MTKWLLVLLLSQLASTAAGETAWRRHVIDASSRGADGVRLIDANRDGRPDIATGWEQGGAVRLSFHPGPATVTSTWPAVTVGDVRDVEDAVGADLDGDGSIDVVSCAEGKTRAIAVHWGPAGGEGIRDPARWNTEFLPPAQDRMMWMFALPLQVDGRHGIDLVAGGKGPGAALGWFEAPANARQLDLWQWHEWRPVGWLMSLAPADVDGDGDVDLIFSDRKGARSGAYWLEHPGPGESLRQPWREHPIGGVGAEAMFLQVVDFDRDGNDDVLLAVRPRQILWLRRQDRAGRTWESHAIPWPEQAGSAKAVQAGDVDGDGRLDIVLSCEHAQPPLHGLMWLSADGAPQGGRWITHVLSGPDGVKHDLIALVDLDEDGDLDVITTEEVRQLGVIWYENPFRAAGRPARADGGMSGGVSRSPGPPLSAPSAVSRDQEPAQLR